VVEEEKVVDKKKIMLTTDKHYLILFFYVRCDFICFSSNVTFGSDCWLTTTSSIIYHM